MSKINHTNLYRYLCIVTDHGIDLHTFIYIIILVCIVALQFTYKTVNAYIVI